MPNTKSAAKRLRQSIKRRDRNRATKTGIRGQTRKVRELIAAGDVAAAEEQFRLLAKKIDRAASARVVHANLAARVKSRLSARLKAAKAPAK
jgi:small subunit ribosomal protein S20